VLAWMRLIDNLLESVRIESGQVRHSAPLIELAGHRVRKQLILWPVAAQRGLVLSWMSIICKPGKG